jgi:hypothetical protein
VRWRRPHLRCALPGGGTGGTSFRRRGRLGRRAALPGCTRVNHPHSGPHHLDAWGPLNPSPKKDPWVHFRPRRRRRAPLRRRVQGPRARRLPGGRPAGAAVPVCVCGGGAGDADSTWGCSCLAAFRTRLAFRQPSGGAATLFSGGRARSPATSLPLPPPQGALPAGRRVGGLRRRAGRHRGHRDLPGGVFGGFRGVRGRQKAGGIQQRWPCARATDLLSCSSLGCGPQTPPHAARALSKPAAPFVCRRGSSPRQRRTSRHSRRARRRRPPCCAAGRAQTAPRPATATATGTSTTATGRASTCRTTALATAALAAPPSPAAATTICRCIRTATAAAAAAGTSTTSTPTLSQPRATGTVTATTTPTTTTTARRGSRTCTRRASRWEWVLRGVGGWKAAGPEGRIQAAAATYVAPHLPQTVPLPAPSPPCTPPPPGGADRGGAGGRRVGALAAAGRAVRAAGAEGG